MRGPMLVPEFDGIRQSFTPGQCFLCKTSAADRGVLCTGEWITNKVETARYGKVQFCGECIKSMAGLFGLVASDVHDRLDAKVVEYSDARKRLDGISTKLSAALKALDIPT